ncbi:MAG: PsbP-related protein [Planctomycetota bacterium]
MTGHFNLTTLTLVVLSSILADASRVSADVYSDPSGFSINYPDGWFPLSKAQQGQIQSELPPALQNAIQGKQIDLSQIAVMIMRNGDEEYLESLNVVVNDSQIPVSASRTNELRNMITQQYSSMGASISSVEASVKTYSSQDVYVIDYSMTLPGIELPLRQRQYMVPGDGKSYIITCSSTETAFAKHEATFEQMMNSFQAPAPKNSGFDLSRIGGTGLVGVIVGGLIGLLKAFSGRSKNSQG